MASIYQRDSLLKKYVVSGTSEFDLSNYNFNDYDLGSNFKYTTVRYNESCRPDIIAQRLYGTSDLWWFVLWSCGIQDPWHDLLSDVAIKYWPIETVKAAIKQAYDNAHS